MQAISPSAGHLVLSLRHSLGGVIYTRTEAPATAPVVTLTTLIQDHLGSTDALLTGTWDGNAFASHTIERQSFAAFGERRDATTWDTLRTAAADPQHTSTLDIPRGFTGHEHLDDSGLIHMNGRIYDPEVGRFLSPDPVVQIPEYSQDFNRYTYTLNNPLNATDPSGFSWISKVFSKVGKWIKENFRQCRGQFGARRKDGARRMRGDAVGLTKVSGLWSLQDLGVGNQ